MRKIITTKVVMMLLLILSVTTTKAQDIALKTNLLSWSTTTLNVGWEVATSDKQTFQIFGSLNPWKFGGDKKLRFWNVMPEYHWWSCRKFGGHFFGAHALGGEYNIKNIDLPFGTLPKTKEGRHYEGWYIGAGLTYGYQWLLSKHFNLEAEVGVGYAYSPYKLYGNCEKVLDKSHRNYVGPTKVGLSLMYVF